MADREHSGTLHSDVLEDEIISERRVVCVTSRQFLALGFQNQIEIVQRAFPQLVQHDIITTSDELRGMLTARTVDVVHIATYVCPRTGDLYFSDVDADTGSSVAGEPDVLTADALAGLLKRAQTRLVVVGSCESLVLAATLLPVTNVVATRDMVSAKMMARWVEVFYNTLLQRPLSEAFDIAVSASGAKMRLFARTDVQLAAPAIGAATGA
jgi:hypothetical protein